MTVAVFIDFLNVFIKQKTVQTLLKWLFWTSINLDIIKQNIILAEVFVSIPFLNKINNLNDLFSHKICCSINVQYNVYIFFCNYTF